MTPCPGCRSPLKSGKTRHDGDGNIERRRCCRSCGYRDITVSKPEVLLHTFVLSPPAVHSAIGNTTVALDIDRITA